MEVELFSEGSKARILRDLNPSGLESFADPLESGLKQDEIAKVV